MSMQIGSMKLGKVNFVLFILFTSFSQHKFWNAVSYPNIFYLCSYCKREPSRIYYFATGFIFWLEYI